jgi:3-isopropylmalate/(R)-2-methylmalate dehydratase large subunit
LEGATPKGVMARDVFHYILLKLGPASCRFQVLELAGSGLDNISIEGLQTITGLAMFTGALTAIANPTARTLSQALPIARKQIEPLFSDADAGFAAVHTLDVTNLEPLVAAPPNPGKVRPLSEFAGTEVQAGYLGSCASGRLEDLRIAADVLRGRRVKPGFSLHVIPTSNAILAQAANEGILTTLVEAGAFVSSSSCDFCSGNIATITGKQRAVSTGPLNVPGRMGDPDGQIYLCNAAAVAAAAIDGCISDPRKFL